MENLLDHGKIFACGKTSLIMGKFLLVLETSLIIKKSWLVKISILVETFFDHGKIFARGKSP